MRVISAARHVFWLEGGGELFGFAEFSLLVETGF